MLHEYCLVPCADTCALVIELLDGKCSRIKVYFINFHRCSKIILCIYTRIYRLKIRLSIKVYIIQLVNVCMARITSSIIQTISNMAKMHSSPLVISGQNLTVKILPALQDNFMYLIIDENTRDAAIVDPVDPDIACRAVDESKVNLKMILTTHHHWDHSGGNKRMCGKFRDIVVAGGDTRIEGINKRVSHGDTVDIGNLKVNCLATPCHTSGHICYLITDTEDNDPPSIFTGDTLFVGGCGRFFEGTPDQMHKALNETLGSLPDKTRVYCGHEYTCKNLQFGLTVEPNNTEIIDKLKWANEQRSNELPTVPSTIGSEKKINPFMRVNEPSVMLHTSMEKPIDVMASLRTEKDQF